MSIIQLEDKHYIGEGVYQKCYIHPNNDRLCLKVRKKDDTIKPRIDSEIKYYKKIQKKKIALPFIAKYHGELTTNLGEASVYDLIRNETTNEVSLTIYDYLKMEKSPYPDEIFVSKLETLKQKLIKRKIMVTDLTVRNVCCKILKNNSFELIIIDGVGHKDFIPLVEYIYLFAKRKMNKVFVKKKLYSMKEHMKYIG